MNHEKKRSILPETMTFTIDSRPSVAGGDQIWEQIRKIQPKLNNLAFGIIQKASETAKLRHWEKSVNFEQICDFVAPELISSLMYG